MTINSISGNTVLESGSFAPARVATTAAITLSGLQTIDGVALAAGDRVLVKDQADQTQNGIYAASSGNWVRTTDAIGNQQFFQGMAVTVALGTVNGGQTFLCTSSDDPVVVGSSLITFASQTAVQQALQMATSTTSQTIGTGSKTFAVQSGKSFKAGQTVVIYQTSNIANKMAASITNYTGGALVVAVTAVQGSGTIGDWTIALANSAAAAGIMPPTGTGDVSGPGAATLHNVPRFADTTGKVLEDSGIQIGALGSRTTLQHGDAGAGSIQAAALDRGAAPLPDVGALGGSNLLLANDTTNPNTDITVSVGRCRGASDLTNLEISAKRLKRIDAAWAAGGVIGTRAGLLDTGTVASSKTYHVYIIGKLGVAVAHRSRTSNVVTLDVPSHGLGVGSDVRVVGVGAGYDGLWSVTSVPDANTITYANTGSNEAPTAVAGATLDAFDILASLSVSAPTMPSGWTSLQALGSILTDSSGNIRKFTQVGDFFRWYSPTLDVNQNVGTSSTTLTLSVPLGISVEALLNVVLNTVGGAVYLRNVGDADLAGGTSTAPLATAAIGVANNSAPYAIQARVWTSTNAQIEGHADASGRLVLISALGWRDPRRRLF